MTITGGKWTTYRLMAEDAMNRAIDSFFLTPDRECQTNDVRLVGAEGWCVRAGWFFFFNFLDPRRDDDILDLR